MKQHRSFPRSSRILLTALIVSCINASHAEDATSSKSPAAPPAITALGWLEGCWQGNANQREFREYWLPLRGGMIVGAGQTVFQEKTQDFEYMRVEARPDGVYYVTVPSGKPETSFKLATITDDGHGTEFTFANGVDEFPQRIVYRRGGEGWLYASVEGKLNGEERKVIYPMRRIGCESGELIVK